MDGKGFQVWLSAARGLTRAQRREALAVLSGRSEGEASKAAIERCGRGPALSALLERRGGFAGMARGLRRCPVQGLRQDLQRAERYAAVGLAPQGTLAVVRGRSLAEGGDGEGLGGETLRRGGEHGVPLASPVSGGGAKRFGGAQGDRWKRTRPTSWRAGRARAGWDARHGGGAARRRSAAFRASRCRFSWRRTGAMTTVSAVLPRVDAAALTAALDPVVAKDALAGLRWRELPTLRRRARGEPRSAQPLDGGTGSGRSACADGEQPPQPVEGLPAFATRWTTG